MLIGLFISLLFGGGTEEVFLSPDIVKQVKQQVEDKERKEELLNILKAGKKEVKAFRKTNGKTVKSIEKGIGSKDVQTTEIESQFEKALTERRAFQASIIEKRLKIQELMTEEEWDAIVEPVLNPSDKALKKDTKVEAKEDKGFVKTRDGIREAIEQEIAEGERKEQIIEALEAWEMAYEELFETNQEISYTSDEVLSNRSASREEFEDFYGELDGLREKTYRSFNDFLSVVRENTTEEEWKGLSKKVKAVFKN